MRWDSGQEFIYRIGDEDAYDLRVSSPLSSHYFFVLITFCLFRCPASFIQLMFELVGNFFYFESSSISTFVFFI